MIQPASIPRVLYLLRERTGYFLDEGKETTLGTRLRYNNFVVVIDMNDVVAFFSHSQA